MAPEILVGYHRGFRHSWDCATGSVAERRPSRDNTKSWSGDHCVDPRLVPGVFWCNRKIAVDDPNILDIAPTALDLFGVKPCRSYMQGKNLFDPPDRRRRRRPPPPSPAMSPREGVLMKLPRWTSTRPSSVLAVTCWSPPFRGPRKTDPYEGRLRADFGGDGPANAPTVSRETKHPQLVVLGIDGMDPDLLREEALALYGDSHARTSAG